jgi:hypothetical protein
MYELTYQEHHTFEPWIGLFLRGKKNIIQLIVAFKN